METEGGDVGFVATVADVDADIIIGWQELQLLGIIGHSFPEKVFQATSHENECEQLRQDLLEEFPAGPVERASDGGRPNAYNAQGGPNHAQKGQDGQTDPSQYEGECRPSDTTAHG